jgi:RimJ/RimL family protein N-acetyltransferase
VTLRPWRADDAGAVFDACQDPEIQRCTTVPAARGQGLTTEALQELRRRFLQRGVRVDVVMTSLLDTDPRR